MIFKTSSDLINELKPNEVFVFGSNEAGLHGAGAAAQAYSQFGANYQQGFGYTENRFGKTFAIPTKDWDIRTLPLSTIQFYVNRFIDFAKLNMDKNFLVTQIGCGLAGYTPEDIAPLFKRAIPYENIYLPKTFIDYLNSKDPRDNVTIY